MEFKQGTFVRSPRTGRTAIVVQDGGREVFVVTDSGVSCYWEKDFIEVLTVVPQSEIERLRRKVFTLAAKCDFLVNKIKEGISMYNVYENMPTSSRVSWRTLTHIAQHLQETLDDCKTEESRIGALQRDGSSD